MRTSKRKYYWPKNQSFIVIFFKSRIECVQYNIVLSLGKIINNRYISAYEFMYIL